MAAEELRPGDWVIYKMQKASSSPGPRAKATTASSKGENYTYIVDKFWIVEAVEGDEFLLRTRKGKQHRINKSDSRLRKPSWFQKLMYSSRFKAVEASLENSTEVSS